MKRTIQLPLLGITLNIALVAVGCSKEKPKAVPSPVAVESTTATFEDGIYFAADEEFASSGWKETLLLTVSGGKITKVDWNGVNIAGGADKKTFDKAGKYNMVKFGKAQSEWFVQAQKAEQHLIETQDPKAITYKDKEGHTDDIGGVSIHVDGFFHLVEKALEAGPVGRGSYTDGVYFAINEQFGDSGFKEYISITVLNGRITAVNWSGINCAGDDKKVYDKAGNYKMVEIGNAQDEWFVQAQKSEQHLIEKQDPKAITYKDAIGRTDDIAGISIHVDSMFALAEKALASGVQKIGPYSDGSYYATQKDFDTKGWKGFVSLYVSNGNIVQAYYSGMNAEGEEKQTFASEGKYGMINASTIGVEWHQQAQAAEAYLIKTQDPKNIKFANAEGNTDDIAGVSMNVGEFFTLASKALNAGPKK